MKVELLRTTPRALFLLKYEKNQMDMIETGFRQESQFLKSLLFKQWAITQLQFFFFFQHKTTKNIKHSFGITINNNSVQN